MLLTFFFHPVFVVVCKIDCFKNVNYWTIAFKRTWISESLSDSIPQCEELSIIEIVKQVMIRVVCRTIYHWFKYIRNSIIPVVYRYCPKVHKYEQSQICKLVKWNQKGIYVVRTTLQKAVQRVKGVASVGCRYLPFMVGLVNICIYSFMMQCSMDPVYTHVCKQYKRHNTEHNPKPT